MEARDPATVDQEQQLLAQRIQHFTDQGWRVEGQSAMSATVVKGRRPNHLLHLILTLVTFGLWGFVWLGIVIFGSGEQRRVLTIN